MSAPQLQPPASFPGHPGLPCPTHCASGSGTCTRKWLRRAGGQDPGPELWRLPTLDWALVVLEKDGTSCMERRPRARLAGTSVLDDDKAGAQGGEQAEKYGSECNNNNNRRLVTLAESLRMW